MLLTSILRLMPRGNPGRQRQSQARSRRSGFAHVAGAKKAVENAGLFVIGNADTSVADLEAGLGAVPHQPEADGSAGRRVLAGVFEDDVEQTGQIEPVGHDHGGAGGQVRGKANAGFAENLAPLAAGLGAQELRIDVLQTRVFGTGIDPRQEEKAVEQRRHLLRFRSNGEEGETVFMRGAVEAESEIGLGADEGNRRAQLMRGVGGEVADGANAKLDALEHVVECGGQVGELIVRVQARQPALEIAFVNALRFAAMAATGSRARRLIK